MTSFWSMGAAAEMMPAPQGRRRYLVLSLPRWATDCLRRAEPETGQAPRPLALWERQRGAMRLVAVDALAARAGLHPEQSLADARALCPRLEVHEIDRPRLEAGFAEFADWHSNASPIVAVLPDMAAYGDLCLDITGVSHLFGGEARMLEALIGRLERAGFTVAGAIAPTVGAAWALARFVPGQVADDPEAVLGGLPMAALRLDDGQLAGLQRMGLKQVGQLYGRDRKALQARFGLSLITRLDQALGRCEERLVPRLPPAERHVERRFAEPIGLLDDVLMCARDLAIRLAVQLEAEGMGAQGFHLFLYRVDHKVMTLSVNAARATRDPEHIARLFANRVERLVGEYDAGFGIDMIRLAASSVSEVNPAQIGAFETRDGAEDLDRLYDRMSNRLGPLAVLRTRFVNSHIPERAAKLEPVIARTADDPQAAPDPRLPRPLRLLSAPEAITVTAEVPDGPPAGMVWRRIGYRFRKASGPERIAVEWWRPGEGALTRDYFVAEDDGGRRFWIFREGLYGETARPGWFMHGFFA